MGVTLLSLLYLSSSDIEFSSRSSGVESVSLESTRLSPRRSALLTDEVTDEGEDNDVLFCVADIDNPDNLEVDIFIVDFRLPPSDAFPLEVSIPDFQFDGYHSSFSYWLE